MIQNVKITSLSLVSLGNKEGKSLEKVKKGIKYYRRERFLEYINMGYSVRQAGNFMGLSQRDIHELRKVPLVRNTIIVSRKHLIPSLDELQYRIGQMLGYDIGEVFAFDENGGVEVKNPSKAEDRTWTGIKKCKIRKGKLEEISMVNVIPLVNLLLKIWKLQSKAKP